jgi:hypothetical protein
MFGGAFGAPLQHANTGVLRDFLLRPLKLTDESASGGRFAGKR